MTTTMGHRHIANLSGDVEEEVYAERTVDLRTMKDALRRCKVFWAGCAALGLLIGAVVHLAVPAKYTAVSMVYLTEPTSGSTYTLADDVNLFNTNRVASLAASMLDAGRNGPVPGSYEGIAVGGVLMEVQADASTPSRSVRWAHALASAFFSVRAQTLGGQTKLVNSLLQLQAERLAADVRRTNNALTVLSQAGASPSSANQVAQLESERDTDAAEITSLQNEVQQNLIEQSVVDKGSYVLDPPAAALVHTDRIFVEDGLSGLVAGLAIGLGITVVGAVISDHPRRRAEVAWLLRAPVEVSLRGDIKRARRTAGGVRRAVKRPSPAARLAQHRLRQRITLLPRSSLALIGTGKGSTHEAAVLLVGTAVSLADDGKRVAIVDMAEGRPLAKLFGARGKRGTVRTVDIDGKQLRLVVAPEDATAIDSGEARKGAEAVLVLANLDPATGAEQLRPWIDGAVVVLRAGKSSELLIEATGQMLRGAGVPVLSSVLLGADRGDETSGLIEAPWPEWVAGE